MSLAHADGDFHSQGLTGRLAGAGIRALELDRACRAVQHFIERHQNVAFDILAALREDLAVHSVAPTSSRSTARTIPSAEILLEEIAETGSAEMELSAVVCSSRRSAWRGLRLPPRLIPI